MNTQVTIAEYATRHSVSVTTVRYRIKAGVLSARFHHGRYLINEHAVAQNAEQADS